MPYLCDTGDIGRGLNAGFCGFAPGKGPYGEDDFGSTESDAVTGSFKPQACVRACDNDSLAFKGCRYDRQDFALGTNGIEEGCHFSWGVW